MRCEMPAGAKTEQTLPVDGHDIWSAVSAGGKSTRDTFLINTTPADGAIRVGDWKLVVGEGGMKGKVELFDLAKDPGEQTDLSGSQPEKVKELQAKLAKFAAEAVPPKAAPQPKGFKTPKIWGEMN